MNLADFFTPGTEIGEFKPGVVVNDILGLTTYLHEDVPYVAHPLTCPDGTKAHWVDALLAMDDGRLVGVNFWFVASASSDR